jgi:hypothetical protein
MLRTTTANTSGEHLAVSTCERSTRSLEWLGQRRPRPANPGPVWSDGPGPDSDRAGVVSVWIAGWIRARTRTDVLRPLAYAGTSG